MLFRSLSRSYSIRLVFAAVCDKLFDITPDVKIVPQLATGYTWAKDGMSVVIKLRPNVKFHDGEVMDAEAVRYNIDRSLNMKGTFRRAEIGAIKALREAGVPIDFVGGASMGGIIGAGVATGWSQEELDYRIRKAFVDSSPVDDLAVPIIAMTRGRKVDRRLQEHFGELLIEDLWLPFYCVSSNITSGGYVTHMRGLLRQALRASIAIPGILPPVVAGGAVLVDGAVMRNFPVETMRAWHAGPIVGVDVSRVSGVDPATLENPKSWWMWLLTGAWRQGPPIVSIMIRSATLTTKSELMAAREASDILIIPNPDGVEIRDWKAYDKAVENGWKAAREALAKVEGPVPFMRRRKRAADRHAAVEAIRLAAPPQTAVRKAKALLRRVAGETPARPARGKRSRKTPAAQDH